MVFYCTCSLVETHPYVPTILVHLYANQHVPVVGRKPFIRLEAFFCIYSRTDILDQFGGQKVGFGVLGAYHFEILVCRW